MVEKADKKTSVLTTENDKPSGTELARAEDVLPTNLVLLPMEKRPFFPGQILPLIIRTDTWGQTFKQLHDSGGASIGVVYVRGANPELVKARDFSRVGTVCRIHRIEQHDEQLHVILAGLQRFKIKKWVSSKHPFQAQVRYYPERNSPYTTAIKAYTTAIVNVIKELLPLNPLYGEELKMFLNHFGTSEPARLADFGASLTTADAKELQQILETVELQARMEKTLQILHKELEVARAQMEIREQIEKEVQSYQREAFLRQQLKFIQKELGISKDDRTAEVEKFRIRIQSLVMSEQVRRVIEEELDKLQVLERGSAEYTVTRNYLDWLTIVPWGIYSQDVLDLDKARQTLDKDHEGLKDVKDRILEFIAVGKMKGEISGSILLLVGPPGVGKTSLGRSIATTLGRKFYRLSLGGMRDEAEIKGHRRTYIGAMPGKFIQALRESKTSNPVIMLDELDKMGASYRGDPASALLEVLDPEQNRDFLDHYLDVRADLSHALFICTANQLDTIPPPLLDRMEVIRLSGYLAQEKIAIARNHLLPRQLERAGLKKRGQLRIDSVAIRKIIALYVREAGVRRLEKLLGSIARKAVVKLLDGSKAPIHVQAKDVEEFLGKPIYDNEHRIDGVGVVTGLAWTALGGATLDVEATQPHNYRRALKLTGQLGDVMKESAEIAYSFVLANTAKLQIKASFFEKALIHLHVPAGATPKDGPSAGITMASALVSLARNKKPKRSLAMTGELTLTGLVLPVGGIREKVIAARRMKIRQLLLPLANRGDFEELPSYIRTGIKCYYVSRYDEVLVHLF